MFVASAALPHQNFAEFLMYCIHTGVCLVAFRWVPFLAKVNISLTFG